MTKGFDFLGDKIRKLRQIRNISQTELGKLLGLPKQSISRIEKGSRKVTLEELDKISDYFAMPKSYLLQGEWIEDTYEDMKSKNRWNVSVPEFVDNFLECIDKYFEESLHSPYFNKRTAKDIVRDTKIALDKILKEHTDN
jgi:transcriptional regulator with XRE-family HTH domain